MAYKYTYIHSYNKNYLCTYIHTVYNIYTYIYIYIYILYIILLCTIYYILYTYILYTGWPTKMSLFSFGNNFYKNKETFKNFSPQILKVYRILLLETTLELIMFYYTFSVIDTMFVPCTALLHDSTAATRTLKLSTTLLNISSGMHLVSLLVMSCLVCGLFSQTLSFRYPLRK